MVTVPLRRNFTIFEVFTIYLPFYELFLPNYNLLTFIFFNRIFYDILTTIGLFKSNFGFPRNGIFTSKDYNVEIMLKRQCM